MKILRNFPLSWGENGASTKMGWEINEDPLIRQGVNLFQIIILTEEK